MGNAQQGPAAQAQLQLLAALMESGARAGRAMVAAGRGVDRAAERKALEDECREFATRHQAELEPLWRCYDANNDGALDSSECRRLVEDALQRQRDFLAKHVIDRMAEQLKDVPLPADRVRADAVRESREQALKELHKQLDARFKELYEQRADIAKRVFKGMDKDSNQRVTKEEFLRNYVTASLSAVSAETSCEAQ